MTSVGNPKPLVSVIVVNWNRLNLLQNCLSSLERQTYSPFEVIVVDNGSEDGSWEWLQNYAAIASFPLVLVRNNLNYGFAKANNIGIQKARGKYIALLNNDAEAEPDWLFNLVDSLEKFPEFGMAASKILNYHNPRIIDKVGHLIYPDGQNRGRGSGELDTGQYDTYEEVLWPDGCAALYRRALFEDVGLFDETFFAYGEDAELGLRARIAGWRCLYVPTAIVRHHRGATLGLHSAKRLQLIERNRILLAVKHFPLGLLCLNPVFYLIRILSAIPAALKGQGELAHFPGWRGKFLVATSLLRGNLEALQHLPEMICKRRQLKSIRRLKRRELYRMIFTHRAPLRLLVQQAPN